MIRIVIALAFALGLSGCTTLTTLGSVASTQNPVTMTTVFQLRSAYDAAVLSPAANYRRIGDCAKGVHSTVVAPCAERNIVLALQKINGQWKVAIGKLQTFVESHPGQLGASGLYDAASLVLEQGKSLIATIKS